MSDIPPVNMEPIIHVDMSPDAELPLRILRVYRANCDVRFSFTGTVGNLEKVMNGHQIQRAAILDRAIATLERGGKVRQGMSAARVKGRMLGRPVKNARYITQVRRLHRKGKSADQIHRRLRGTVSLPWIYLQIRKIKGEK